ncbi:hypothetical protein AAG570_001657 [Ranatra chinensis]|uniref:Helix-hairpin-helix domain-containing protein n=1 Tax=Ranatra chinensis TaxID=642074 RepID=A0ABD0Y9F3_9HEMI
MTLPGVTRAVARNIVEYRQAIGRFNKVEDLALVSGIGADRLDEIRPEICVNKRKNQSAEVSPPPHHSSRPPLDVNTATVFQLMTVRGINQELAAAIVEYRDRRGDFFSLDDLLKVG